MKFLVATCELPSRSKAKQFTSLSEEKHRTAPQNFAVRLLDNFRVRFAYDDGISKMVNAYNMLNSLS
jgi:hypothetical protein